MDGYVVLLCFAAVIFLLVKFGTWVMNDTESDSVEDSPSAVTPPPSRSTRAPRPTDTELLSGLPATYYVLAILCGIVLMIFTLVNADKFNSFQIGSLIGYTVGGVLSMLAVGRVIELLQDIRDAVRS